MKKALIIVPHPDDEINVAGSIIPQLKNNFEITVCYVTNGDFDMSILQARHKELKKSCAVLGVSDIVLLGYSDNWTDNHIFNAIDKPITYANGKSETYGINGIDDYCYSRHGYHHKFLRENVKIDLKELLEELKAELVICVDYDQHPDHRMSSQIFDEAMEEEIRFNNYRPIVLKKFAYLGVWTGKKDYFNTTNHETQENDESLEKTYFQCLPYRWEDRIRFKSDEIDYGPVFFKSRVFKALMCHRSQRAWRNFESVSNSDAVYWYRNTNDLMIGAKISTTSGDKSFLNNFKLMDPRSISISLSGKDKLECDRCWKPDTNDNKKEIRITFDKPVDVTEIDIYQNYQCFGHVEKFEISFNGGKKEEIVCDATDLIRISDERHNVKEIVMNNFSGKGTFGIREIEAYENNDFPYEKLGLIKYSEDGATSGKYLFWKLVFKVFSFFKKVDDKLTL